MDLFLPTYFPNIRQMAALIQSQDIVFECHDNYQKQTYRNRMDIAHAQGILTLSIPIKHNKDKGRLKTHLTQSESEFPWASQHWKSIQTAYRSSPFFEYYEDDLCDLFDQDQVALQQHNLKIFSRLTELLGCSNAHRLSREYYQNTSGFDFRYLANIKQEQKIDLPRYMQVFQSEHGFLSNLSVLDLLFNLGPESLSYLEHLELG
ncbi:WbqC family protein [Flavobacteriaceae bacterium]|nr:WbqC family protein [Flavobacteriaceae bacterium]